MIYQVIPDGDGFRLNVWDGGECILSILSATLTEAKALQRRAVLEGIASLEEVRPETKKKVKKNG